MKTYTLVAHVTVSALATVRARSRAEALQKAKAMRVVIGGRGDDDDAWVIDDADGEPHDITIEGEPTP